jgi:hypothetical protein
MLAIHASMEHHEAFLRMGHFLINRGADVDELDYAGM